MLKTFANSLDPDQARQNIDFVRPDLGLKKCLTLWLYSWNNFSKKFILKKSADDKKFLKNFPVGRELNTANF